MGDRYRGRGRGYTRPQSRGGDNKRPQRREVNPHSVKYLSWEEITKMANGTSEDVVRVLQTNEAGFLKVFNHDLSCRKPDILKKLIKIVYMLVKSQEVELASRVLGQIYSPEGSCAQFSFHVNRLIVNIPTDDHHRAQQNQNYLIYLLDIGLFGIHAIPKTMLEIFSYASIKSTVEMLKSNGHDVTILQKKCEELDKQFDLARAQVQPQRAPTAKQATMNEDELEPPNRFTDITVLPTNEDLISERRRKPFLRSNKIIGPYKGWDHYLDVQFRLLREDFIAPLREGIYESSAGHHSQIRMYEDVHVLTPVCLFTGMGFEISFSTKHFQKTKWEYSRRLIFGSLLCLSNHDFREHSPIIFATVIKRDPDQLTKGRLIIKFEGDVTGFDIDPSVKYTMVESTAYFEAYRHVLLGLQQASRIQDTMPFQRYIVDCKLKSPSLPLYHRIFNDACINLKSILDCKNAENIRITVESTWPHHKLTCLDKSQYEALKMALKQEISVIQGPPGTGKTYIGLKLVQAFLHNRQAWDPEKNSPVLVVCYTNHAIDQFLEDIVDAYAEGPMKPPEIVRIGGRCKSEKLANFVLAKKVNDVRDEKSLPSSMYKRSRECRSEMETQKISFNAFEKVFNPSEQTFLSLSLLQSVINDKNYFQLTQGMPTQQGKEIEVWLKLWNPTDNYEFTEVEEPEQLYENNGTLVHNTGGIPPVEDEEDEFITVDEEARILQEERMIEGEEIINEMEEEDDPAILPRQMPRQKRKPTTEWQTVQMSDHERNRKVKRGLQLEPMEEKEASQIEDVRILNEDDRWRLYQSWVNKYLKEQKLHLKIPAERYNNACEHYSSMKEEIDCYVARGCDIIAMTTTGAAKHHHILKNIHPKIVVIEEAAEVFESHVVTSLSPSVQQLVLIGDHKQLRPKPTHYELETKYNLAVSLFERLVLNGIPYVNLTVQHRMRPDIASLICPAIYKQLENGPKAIEHGKHKIAGVGHNLFFLDHTHPEKQQDPNESFSHVNIHEANFMVSFCRYLLKQGYRNDQITLLTMYKGQLMQMKKLMKRSVFEGVRVAAVDDFQGEENDIILLSLVRSNSDGKIGFLQIENRVCVALSRARKGLYVIGNFSMLRNQEKTIWPTILSVVDEKRCIGNALLLQCQIHPEQRVNAMFSEDFSKCPEGGCTKRCNFRLKCGHGCTRLCHPWDRDHRLYKCQKICVKMLHCHHRCNRKCYECIDQCAPCTTIVEKQIPQCGHKKSMQCHEAPSRMLCTNQCEKLLGCGHQCQMLCSQKCNPHCPVQVPKTLPCGHTVRVECYKTTEKIVCSVPCNNMLQCGHKCHGTCGRCQQGRLHIHCESECGRTLVCGHICNSPCAAECPPCSQICSNYCKHSKCPRMCYEPCDPCAEPCEWNCKHLKCTKRCGEPCIRPRCDRHCRKTFKCGHPCIGLCGDKCPRLCRVCNRDEVTEIFFGNEDEEDARFVELEDCGHVFEYTGLDQWIDNEDDKNEVQFKKCPKCKTLIRTSLRYYNEIKKTHNDFEEIKKRQLASSDFQQLARKFKDLRGKYDCEEIKGDVGKIYSLINPATRPCYILPHCLSAIENQLEILPSISKMYTGLTQVKYISWRLHGCMVTTETLHQDLQHVQRFLMQDSLTDQQLDDIQCEMRRLDCVFRLFQLYSIIKDKKVTITPEEKSMLKTLASSVVQSGAANRPKVSEDTEKEVSALILHFETKYQLEGLTEAEKIEIVKAIGLTKGHWFKCRNGHYYCIGECGGATEEAKCPECDATIGGRDHTLAEGNMLAPEMDGAAYAAWSTQANMQNYDLDNLQRFQ